MSRQRKSLFLAIILTVILFPSGCNKGSTDLGKFSLDETYSRYYAETTLALTPSQNYGEIYPYIGGITPNPFAVNPFIYGFCDAKGSIICDPSFVDMRIFEYQGKKAYVFSKSAGKMSVETRFFKMYIASHDGSFVMEFDKVFDGLDGTFAVRQGEKWGSVDYDGNEILPCIYKYPMFFGEGLAAVSEDFSKGYKYVNKQNETIIALLPSIPENEVSKRIFTDFDIDLDDAYKRTFEELVFQDERAAFFDGDKYGYINKTGEIAIPARFDAHMTWSFKFSNGSTLVSMDEKYTVIDKNGLEVLSPGNYDIYGLEDVYRIYDKDNGRYWYMDSGGAIIIEPYTSDITYEYIGNGWFYKTSDHRECDLVKDRVVYSVGVSPNIQIVAEDRFLVQYFGENGGIYKIIDSAGKIYFDGGEDLYLSFDKGQNLIRVFKKDSWLVGLIDNDGNYILKPFYRSLIPAGDKFMAYQGFYGGLIDQSGNWIMKVSLLDYIND